LERLRRLGQYVDHRFSTSNHRDDTRDWCCGAW
jgi:hypothetical protein